MTGRLIDQQAAWEERQRRNQAVQQLVEVGSVEQIRASPLASLATRVGPILPLHGLPAAVVAEAIYAACGARFGAALVEPNMVVTLAGVRGHTEFGLVNPLLRDAERVLVADRVGREFGVRFRRRAGPRLA